MTRTERATFPRARVRDRSESKSGLDKSLRKGGSGQHNWGSIANEGYLEAAAIYDVEGSEDHSSSADSEESSRDSFEKSESERSFISSTEEQKRLARDFRKTAFKGEGHPVLSRDRVCFLPPSVAIDLSAIARTSAAVSTSPAARSGVPVV
ncbi:hypothetical protein JVU11DRAFT_12091 [Chiua virens]|nr:hypothetical protein JVU11DRAFT_12091 [Chiua virens]